MSKDQATSARRRWYRGATALAIAGAMGIATGLSTTSAMAQGKTLKIGVIYDLTGPFAAGGSRAGYLGTKYAIDMINERGGVEGYKIVPVYADAQSKTEVAINEAERLLNQEKVDMLMGVFSSAHCVPMAQKVDQAKRFMWANVCVASAVFKDKNLKYVFRPQVHSDQFGQASCTFLKEQAKARFNKDVKDLYARTSVGTKVVVTNSLASLGAAAISASAALILRIEGPSSARR